MKGFYRSCKAFYAATTPLRDGVLCDIMVGDYALEGGTVGEFALEWKQLGDSIIPQLRAWDDSWKVLSTMPELLKVLARSDGKHISEEQMAAHLISLGYKDLTPYPKEKSLEQDEFLNLVGNATLDELQSMVYELYTRNQIKPAGVQAIIDDTPIPQQ
jgi:hypothetical protein